VASVINKSFIKLYFDQINNNVNNEITECGSSVEWYLTFNQITWDENLSICHFIDHAAHGLVLDRTRFSAVVILFCL